MHSDRCANLRQPICRLTTLLLESRLSRFLGLGQNFFGRSSPRTYRSRITRHHIAETLLRYHYSSEAAGPYPWCYSARRRGIYVSGCISRFRRVETGCPFHPAARCFVAGHSDKYRSMALDVKSRCGRARSQRSIVLTQRGDAVLCGIYKLTCREGLSSFPTIFLTVLLLILPFLNFYPSHVIIMSSTQVRLQGLPMWNG